MNINEPVTNDSFWTLSYKKSAKMYNRQSVKWKIAKYITSFMLIGRIKLYDSRELNLLIESS